MIRRSMLFCAWLAACAPALQVRPAPASTEATTLEARVARATARCEAVLRAVEREDVPRKGRSKTMPVADQLRGVSADAERARPVAPYRDEGVRACESACERLEAAYLDSLLESTDSPAQAGPWTSDEGRDVLGSATVDARLATWQAFDPAHPFVKFVVVRGASGALEVRVGRLDVGHVDIGGGPALSAGLLRTAVDGGRTVVVEVENTSGGYRPGPLRNRTTLAALEAAGYLPADRAALTVHDNPTGGYDASALIPAKKR